MTTYDRTNWVQCSRDELSEKVAATLRAAGLVEPHFLSFSIYETLVDPQKDDCSDWVVRHPDLNSTFAAGRVQFLLGYDEESFPVYSAGYLNPTWADVLVEAEGSCRARGAPELDHVFLEAVEEIIEVTDGDVARYDLIWGS